MKIDEIIDDIDGLHLAVETMISYAIKTNPEQYESLAVISEELDNISTKLDNYKKSKKEK